MIEMFRMALRGLLLALAIFALPAGGYAASAEKAASISYRVVQGDNLYTLAERYFSKTGDYIVVQRLNKVADPRRLRIGSLLTIPRPLLRQVPVEAVVQSFRGTVFIGPAENRRPAAIGMKVREGDLIQTSEKSFITLRLPDDSHVALPSQTTLRVQRMRRTLLAGDVERSFRIERGRANATVTPQDNPDSDFRISTPVAVSAVRGTRFRMRYDPDGDRATSEVLEGQVMFSAERSNQEQLLPAGFGTANGLDNPISLLPAPELLAPGRIQDDEDLRFALKPLSGAVGYNVQIAQDAGFLDVLDETSISSAEAVLRSLADGNYFVRLTGIDANGLEGFPATYAFYRRLNRLTASLEEKRVGRYHQYLFRWNAPDAPDAQFRFQLSAKPDGSAPLIDEIGLTGTSFVVTDLPAGMYYWRVKTVDVTGGRIHEKWTPLQELRIGAAP